MARQARSSPVLRPVEGFYLILIKSDLRANIYKIFSLQIPKINSLLARSFLLPTLCCVCSAVQVVMNAMEM